MRRQYFVIRFLVIMAITVGVLILPNLRVEGKTMTFSATINIEKTCPDCPVTELLLPSKDLPFDYPTEGQSHRTELTAENNILVYLNPGEMPNKITSVFYSRYSDASGPTPMLTFTELPQGWPLFPTPGETIEVEYNESENTLLIIFN